jgi:hypothetical protein
MYQGHYSQAMGFQERVIAPYGKASPQKSYKGLRAAVPHRATISLPLDCCKFTDTQIYHQNQKPPRIVEYPSRQDKQGIIAQHDFTASTT